MATAELGVEAVEGRLTALEAENKVLKRKLVWLQVVAVFALLLGVVSQLLAPNYFLGCWRGFYPVVQSSDEFRNRIYLLPPRGKGAAEGSIVSNCANEAYISFNN